VGRLDAGGADAIASSQADAGEEQLLDRAAMESGND
jgi:hypothetical protein